MDEYLWYTVGSFIHDPVDLGNLAKICHASREAFEVIFNKFPTVDLLGHKRINGYLFCRAWPWQTLCNDVYGNHSACNINGIIVNRRLKLMPLDGIYVNVNNIIYALCEYEDDFTRSSIFLPLNEYGPHDKHILESYYKNLQEGDILDVPVIRVSLGNKLRGLSRVPWKCLRPDKTGMLPVHELSLQEFMAELAEKLLILSTIIEKIDFSFVKEKNGYAIILHKINRRDMRRFIGVSSFSEIVEK